MVASQHKYARSRPVLAINGTRWFQTWLISLIVAMNTLIVIALVTSGGLANDWQAQFQAVYTVEIPADVNRSDASIDVIMQTLAETPGIASAGILDDARIAELLAPWAKDLPADLPLPTMIDIRSDGTGVLNATMLADRLATIDPDIVIDDHIPWRRTLATAIDAAWGAIIVLVAIALFATTLIVGLTTHSGLVIHADVIDLMHLMGASDRYIANQFQRQAFVSSGKGAAVGVIISLGVIFGFYGAIVVGEAPFSTVLSTSYLLYLGGPLIGMPALVVMASVITAGWTARQYLARLP